MTKLLFFFCLLTPFWVSMDLPKSSFSMPTGEVFVLTKTYELLRLDTLGQVRARFSPRPQLAISSVHFTNRWKMMLFSADGQQLIFLDRFLTQIDRYTLPFELGWISLAAPSVDQSLWLLDESNLSLLRYDFRLQEVRSRSSLRPLLSKGSPRLLQEYQNQVFLYLDEQNEVLVFDLLGNFKDKFSLPAPVEQWQFLGDELCFWDKKQQQFVYWHLYQHKLRYSPSPDTTQQFIQATQTEEKSYFFEASRLLITSK